ncbi:MAG TPA: ATPase, T2SS/T4P/T4SS family [Gemmatimonadaceae bacterium]|nr:ATPase, T2SS/T4P/T4SS family [Gemmatimonadaceae bacterium]
MRERVYGREQLIDLAKRLPRVVAEDNDAIVLELTSPGGYIIGMSDPSNGVAERNVARALRVTTKDLHVKPVVLDRLKTLQEIAYGSKDLAVAGGGEIEAGPGGDYSDAQATRERVSWNSIDSGAQAAAAAHAAQEEREEELGRNIGGIRASAEHVIMEAVRRGASDIHFEPGPEFGRIRLRIDGVMCEYAPDVPAKRMENLINAYADMAGVNAYTLRHEPSDAAITMRLELARGKRVKTTIRFACCPALYGADLTLRVNFTKFRDFEEIGYEPKQLEQICAGLRHRKGVILVTGETGSGKSNSLEAFLRRVEAGDTRKVIQPCDPVEFPNQKRTQIPIENKVTWAKALKSSLRKDPNIFSPGEFRDAEEAQFVYRAADTGHLVLTTVHTNDVAATFGRLRDLGIESYKLGRLTRLIVSQELVRRLCPHCKAPDEDARFIAERLADVVFPGREDVKEAIRAASGAAPFYSAVGCQACFDTGYRGRTVVSEVLCMTGDIAQMAARGIDGEDVVAYAVREHGMMTLAEAAARKALRGLTSFGEVEHLLVPPVRPVSAPNEPQPWEHEANDVGDSGRGAGEPAAHEDGFSLDLDNIIDVEFTDVPGGDRAGGEEECVLRT